MRVLVTCVPQTGHFVPLQPLTRAFVAQGDEVVAATGPDAEDAFRASGVEFRRAGPSFGEWYGALIARTRGVPGDGLAPDRVERYFLPRLFGEIGTALMLDDLLAAAREHQPDLVLFDSVTYAGPIVAAATGALAVQHTFGLLVDDAVTELVSDAVTPIWRQQGLPTPRLAGVYDTTTVTVCPTSLDPVPAERCNVEQLRPAPLPVAGLPPREVPEWVWGRPVVYLTLGTFSNTNLDLFRLVLGSLSELPVNVVATVGRDNDPDTLSDVAANAFVTQFLPQAALLPHCTAVVHHAGAGTAFGTLAHGLPALALPQAADNFAIARRLSAAGAARVLMPDEVSSSSVAEAAASALESAELRTAAARIAREIEAMPDPTEVAARLREKATRVG